MGNTKNPTALWFSRMAAANPQTKDDQGMGTLAFLMRQFFMKNYGRTTLPKTVADYVIYDQQPMSQITKMFQGQYNPQRSNWPNGNNFIAAESEHMVVQSIKLYEAVEPAATIDEADWTPGISDPVAKNATFDLLVNGIKLLTGIPLTSFDNNQLSATVQGATNEDRGRMYLMEPLVILGQTGPQINISINNGITPTTNYNIRVELEGQRFIGN